MNIFDVPRGAVSSKSRMMNDVGIINPGNLLARYPHLPQHLWFKSPYFEKKKKIECQMIKIKKIKFYKIKKLKNKEHKNSNVK